jgi:hypothetical protein
MSAKKEAFLKFLKAARSLVDQGMNKDAIMQFAKNEFGEINELFQKQIDSLFKPKKGIENIKIKDEVFDDTVVKLPVDDTGQPFNPKDPMKQYGEPKKILDDRTKDIDMGDPTGEGIAKFKKNMQELKKLADELEALEWNKPIDERTIKPKKAGKGQFTKAEYLIQRLKNTIKANPDDAYVQENFPNFIKELEANPDLAKNENVFRELGGDLPDNQKITVYDDETLDFATLKPTKKFQLNAQKFKKDFNVTDDEVEKILNMSPDEQAKAVDRYINKDFKERIELADYDVTDLKPNAEGGIVGYYTGGMVDVEPNLSDIGHGSDALMARTRLVSPNSQATTSTGLNYLLAEDNDNIRVPFQNGLSAAKKAGNILVADESLTERAGKELESKMSKFLPKETEKEKQEREMFKMVEDFQKFKRANPDSMLTFFGFREQKKKEKELLKNKILDLAVKYPEKKIINEQGFVDKKNLKEAIDKAELDLEISPMDGLTIKRSIDTEGEQSVTSGTFDINNFSFSSPNLEEGELTSSANFDIGNLNLSGTVDSKDSDILRSGIAFNYDDILKGKFSESDGYKETKLGLDKTFPLSNKFNLNLKGDSNMMITPDGERYTSSDLTPKLSYDDGILSASIAKEIMEGGDKPNLNAGVNYNDFYLKGDNLLSDDRSGIFGYQKEYGDKDGNLFFTAGGEKNIFDDDYTIGAGLKLKYADGGRIGFSKGKAALKTGKAVVDKGRREFMKAAAGVSAGLAALKTGLLNIGGKQATKEVAKELITTPAAPGKPEWFDALVTRVIREGDDVTKTMSTKERQNVYRKTIDDETEVIVTQDLDEGVTRIDIEDSNRNVMGDYESPPTVSLQVTDEIVEEGGARTKPQFTATENDYRNYATDPDGGYDTELVENTVENTKDLTSDLTKIKSYATNKKETMKEFIESKKRKDNVKYANERTSEYAADRGPDYDPSDYIDDMADDFASGGIARMVGE